jgi:phosphoglycerate kinase
VISPEAGAAGPYRSLAGVPVRGRRVLVREDLNVPLRDGVIANDARIRAALATIEDLSSRGARVVVMSHLGWPRGRGDPGLSLRPGAARLGELLGRPVAFVDETVGEKARAAVGALEDGDVLVLENVRFDPGDEADGAGGGSALGRAGSDGR